MYTPRAFKDDDLQSLHAHIENTRLAVLLTHGEHGLQATHVPLLLDPYAGAKGTLYGHIARGNKQWHDLESGANVLVVFPGANAYVSPGFYPSKAENPRTVPTWNYVAVHAWSVPRVIHEATPLLDIVRRLSDRHERGRERPWSVDDAPADYLEGMLKAIVGFELPIERLQCNRKLSQNRSAADREGVRSGLAASSDILDNHLATLMQQP